MSTTYEHTKQVTRLMAGSSHTLSLLMSMLRVCLEYAWSMARVCIGANILFPHWEQNIPTLGTKHSHLGNKTGLRLALNELTARLPRAYGSFATRVSLLLLLTLGSGSVWGQTGYSGVYYIKHNAAPTYYLCTSTVFYDGNHYANSGDMPYLTTATESTITNDGVWDKDAVWRIIKAESGNYYYVVHAVDVHIFNTKGQQINTFTIMPGETVNTNIGVGDVYMVRADGGRIQKKLAVR